MTGSEAVAVEQLYRVLCILGVVLPYKQFMPWVIDNGQDLPILVGGIASSHLAAFGCPDMGVSAVTLPAFVLSDGRSSRVPCLWQPVVGALTVDVSCGPPLYSLLREMRREPVA